jgi:hypothetical protein
MSQPDFSGGPKKIKKGSARRFRFGRAEPFSFLQTTPLDTILGSGALFVAARVRAYKALASNPRADPHPSETPG